jgi:SAM-dependent methyltransferase
LSTTEPATDPAEGGGRLTSNPLARDPSAWVVRFASRLQPGTRVLDVACGHGRNSRYLASRGCHVIAVDSDPACGRSLAGEASVEFQLADLERDSWPFDGQSFDAVVVIHYLHRPLLPLLAQPARGELSRIFGRPKPFGIRAVRTIAAIERSSPADCACAEDGFVWPAGGGAAASALKLERSQPAAVETVAL